MSESTSVKPGSTFICIPLAVRSAFMLALYGELIGPRPAPVPGKALAELQELTLARQAAKAERTALANRLGAAESAIVKRILKRQLGQAERSIAALEAAMAALIGMDAELKRRYDILISIKGVGPVAAAMLVASMSELGQLNRQGAALLAGVAPLNCRQRSKAQPAPHQGRTEPCALRALYGRPVRCPLQRQPQDVPSASPRGWQETESGAGRCDEKARHSGKYALARKSALGATACWTANTDALPKANACRSP
jgi:predicted flap endonuclease-1-like 5' DNA nuclease